MVISILKKIKREFKIKGGLDYRTRKKILFLEENHPGIYKRMVDLNYRMMFKSDGFIRNIRIF